VLGILNKLTLDTFEKLLKKILEAEIDGQETLEAVIGLIFEKAIDESAFASMYAKLCLRLMKEFPLTQPWISPTGTQQDNAFRTLLLRRCQMEFEQDAKWTADDANSQSERAEIRKNIDSLTAEEKLKIAEEDYERGKLKRRVLGNIRFVGELFVQGLISETIIHRCIRSLLNNIKNPEEEDIESLIGLMIATGHKIDVSKSVDIMNSYFERIKELSVHSGLSNRIKFSLMDLMDLRKAKWASK
ncbi:armadillo-type protein, partial [Globomyces pollinis-pini]